ncbi:UbiX family flavin prenyltransferase [Desulfohalovibrio reitneri]|uniref:UbiX family flavin prenyltransferase n=1 Tax=Desulfohalovibrio reitneri TaxID=1307759 RepID=UPI0004A737FB|nr:UbiX family flavin prenyltransferase [Desulfohalovibrio reitneri]
MPETRRILLAVTGASGMPYAIRLAEFLGGRDGVQLHLLLSDAAQRVLALETDGGMGRLERAAWAVYGQDDIAAPPASGSWSHHGMAVVPCSMSSLAAIASGLGSNLVHRAADVTLKERRPLVLMVRETPLHATHLSNMLAADRAGATIMPAAPAFYGRAETVDDLVDFMAARVLDHLGVEHDLIKPWGS